MAIAALLLPGAAQAAAPDELAGLLIQGCLPFAGKPAALRDWAKQIGLPPVPDQARTALLHGAPGQAFDASTDDTKLVLVSSDDGLCSAITNQATSSAVAAALEAGFRQAGLTFRLAFEHDDPRIAAIHDREYLVAKDQRAWRVLAATVKDDKGGEAMLTGAPEVK